MNCTLSSTTNSTYFIGGTSSSFSGKERDAETGYSYFGARYYDAELTTMWQTAKDMNNKYKETSEGGLAVAVNMADC